MGRLHVAAGRDRRILERINALISGTPRNSDEGIGKPEPLEHGFHGYWSRRIADEHRLVFNVVGDGIRIAACRYRYEAERRVLGDVPRPRVSGFGDHHG